VLLYFSHTNQKELHDLKNITIRTMILTAVCLTLCLTAVLPGSIAVQTAAAASSQASTKKADAILSYSKSLIGKVSYKFGVNNPSKLYFDCSSFTKYVFAKQGVSLKWGSSAQSKQGTKVSKNSLEKGDLMFFSVSRAGKINHVGIYMGNGKFIHNTTGSVRGVTISDFNANYQKRFITASRVL
jgi:lipoprotein Spr